MCAVSLFLDRDGLEVLLVSQQGFSCCFHESTEPPPTPRPGLGCSWDEFCPSQMFLELDTTLAVKSAPRPHGPCSAAPQEHTPVTSASCVGLIFREVTDGALGTAVSGVEMLGHDQALQLPLGFSFPLCWAFSIAWLRWSCSTLKEGMERLLWAQK